MGYRDNIEIKGNIIILIICVIIIFMMNACEATLSEKTYNNGIHEGCGGHWVYETAIGHRYSTYFIYDCDKCGTVVELSEKY